MSPTASTILAQLGGSRFVAMTGANNMVYGDNMLQVKMPRMTGAPVNCLRITLTAMEDYQVEAFILRGINCKPAGLKHCYADNLRAVVRGLIGRDISL